MAYEIKPPLWGIKPGKRETRQQVITGAVSEPTVGLKMVEPYFTSTPKQQIMDSTSQIFVSPSMQVRDFTPFAKELIETGTVVLDANRGRMFMWNMPPFSFEINQSVQWVSGGRSICNVDDYLTMKVSGYDVLLSPYIYITGVTRIFLKEETPFKLYFRLSYASHKLYGYGSRRSAFRSKCSSYEGGGEFITDRFFSIQQSIDYENKSMTNCILGLTLPQILGVENQTHNGFYIQGGGTISYGYGELGNGSRRNYTYTGANAFQEGTTSIRARVMLPELFAPVADLPAILTTSAPIISGCIVRFVKNVV